MEWTQEINDYIQTLKPVKKDSALQQRLISLLDFTSLNDTDSEQSIAAFCEKARTSYGNVASVCVYPKFVRLVAAQFAGTPIKADTVANFPKGTSSIEDVLIEINDALEDGAQEIDVVFPYTRYLAGDRSYAQSFVMSCKAACGEKVILKVILETGKLNDPSIIADACHDALEAGANFVKTSTGKVEKGATLEAAATMLLVIREFKRPAGLKVSGGIRDWQKAVQFVELADNIMGRNWVKPATFRIGSSKLLEDLIHPV